MKTYKVTFNTKYKIINKQINGFNIRYAKSVVECLLGLNPEYIHAEIFTRNGVHSKARKSPWNFYNEKRR